MTIRVTISLPMEQSMVKRNQTYAWIEKQVQQTMDERRMTGPFRLSSLARRAVLRPALRARIDHSHHHDT